jgi:glycosyltransferase involved in cell wall biosynthesis
LKLPSENINLAAKLLTMSNNFRVAYDVSLLGAGYISYQSRTGIFRVVEEILLELSQRNGALISPISLNKETTIWEDISSLLYFEKEQPHLFSNFHLSYHSRLHLNKAYIALIHLQRALIHSTKSRSALRYKVGRALQICGSQIAKKEASMSPLMSDYDIYHSSYFPLPDINVLPNVQRVLTIYDLIPLLFPEFVISKIHQRAVDLMKSINIQKDWIICISEQTKQDFCEYSGMDPVRVFVTPLAAASYFYPIQDSFLIQDTLRKYKIPHKPYLLSLCTLEPRKNLNLLIHAFSDFVQAYPNNDLNLVLVGISGWKNNEIFQAVEGNSLLKNRIVFTGYVNDQDLAPIYSGALTFVYPSLYEGFGLPPLEAMQCGTPVITSNSSSLPEVVGDAGILVDPKDQSELSHAIWRLVNDSELRSHLSQKSLIRAQQFSWSKCVDKTIEVYKTAISNKS